MKTINAIFFVFSLIIVSSCSTETSQSIQFVGMLSNSGNMITLTSQSGGKGVFKNTDIINEIPNNSTNSEYSLQVKDGAEVEMNGIKINCWKRFT